MPAVAGRLRTIFPGVEPVRRRRVSHGTLVGPRLRRGPVVPRGPAARAPDVDEGALIALPRARQPLIPLLFGLALRAAAAVCLPAEAAAAPAPRDSPPPHRVHAPGRTGGTVALDSLAGRVVLSTSGRRRACRAASCPVDERLREKYAAADVAIVAINLDKERAAAEAFLAAVPGGASSSPSIRREDRRGLPRLGDALDLTIARDGTLSLRRPGLRPEADHRGRGGPRGAVER